MTRHRLEVADVFRTHAPQFMDQYGSSLSRDQRRAFRAIVACRTSQLGGHLLQCNRCGRERISYNSCRNRHCPKCQAMARAEWVDARAAELLPVPYFHVVFTLPHAIGPVALQNKRIIYGILFKAASETLKEVAADPKHLGAEIGILAVLHTWGSNLMHHPHLHCVLTGGGIALDGSRWVHCKRSRRKKPFFAPVRVLSRIFRGKFIDLLKRAFRKGDLKFHGQLAGLSKPNAFENLLNVLVRKDWVVYAKRPSGAEHVLKYLARYTHSIAISNRRLVEMKDGKVTFRWKDYADGGKTKTMTLNATEFIRRFLLHVLPSGFVRIRHYGFLANRGRGEKLAVCRLLLGVWTDRNKSDDRQSNEHQEKPESCERCPICNGLMIIVQHIPNVGTAARPQVAAVACRSPPN